MNSKLRYLMLLFVLQAVSSIWWAQSAHAAAAEITGREDGKMTVRANGDRLEDVLNALEKNTGLVVKARPAMDDLVSCDLSTVSLEDVLKKLLAAYNYALFQRKGASSLDSRREYLLWVYDKKLGGEAATLPVKPVAWPPAVMQSAESPNDGEYAAPVLQLLPRKDYANEFSKMDDVLQKADLEEALETTPGTGGILVGAMEANSSLSGIGLATGDVIRDINGTPIRSVEDFLAAMKPEALGERTALRIARYRDDKTFAPIYITLHE